MSTAGPFQIRAEGQVLQKHLGLFLEAQVPGPFFLESELSVMRCDFLGL